MTGSNFDARLSNDQAYALIAEVHSAENLMRDAAEAIANLREPTTHGDAVFTLGSIGVEKLAKIFLGCAAVESKGAWPSKAEMMVWGHDIDSLVKLLIARATETKRQAVAPQHVQELVSRLDGSSILPLLFATLSRYGRSGRFHYLDVLATGSEGRFDPPMDYWNRLETHVAEQVPALKDLPRDSYEEFEAFLGLLSGEIAHEFDVWWWVMHRLGLQGCFGALGKKVGAMIWPHGRPDPLRR